MGEDPETIRQSTTLAEQYLKDPNSVDATISKSVLAVAARYGNEALFEQYVSAMKRLHSPEQYYNVGAALAEFRDPRIVERVLELSVSNEVRNQDAPHLIAGLLSNADDQKVAWEWVKAHWPAVEKKTTMSSGPEIVGATRKFCSAEMRDDVQNFFGEHKVSAAERALKQSFEGISTCAKTRARLQTELGAWLQQHGAASKAVSGTPTAELQVIEAHPSPERYGTKNWSIRCKLLRVISGSVPAGLTEITLLVHSPSLTFATSVDELPHHTFVVEFAGPISDPYAGSIQVQSSGTVN